MKKSHPFINFAKGHYYFLLLTVFFVLHGLAENLFVINYTDAIGLLCFYLVIELVFFFIVKSIYKNVSTAAFISFISFGLFFFFGAVHDFLKRTAPHFVFRYSFLLPVLVIGFVIFLLLMRKRSPGNKTAIYLNILFVVLITVDIVDIGYQIARHKTEDFKIAETPGMYKPDVYLVVLDGYAGSKQLTETFHFDNNRFYDSLAADGFTIATGSSSNYTQTPWSMASLLSMSYLDELKNFDYTDKNLNYCYKKISQSKVVSGFSSLGYEFVNYSVFDFKNESSKANKTFLKSGTALITSQTLWSRIKKDLYYNFLMTHMKNSSLYRDFMFADLRNNELLYNSTIKESDEPLPRPRFVYTHLMMPHFPYYYNSSGKLNDINSISPDNVANDSLYLEYLQYTNNQVLKLVNNIIHGNKNSIIILLSDHGYRYTKARTESLSNFSAIYDPEKKIHGYYQTISNVNIFRVLFNDLFHANLPVLEDKHFK